MGQESESLLYLELGSGNYANAFIWNSLVVTAHHLARQDRIVTVPADLEWAPVSFEPLPDRDVAVSHNRTFQKGFERVGPPRISDEIMVIGHHGPERQRFEIEARVVEVLTDGRIVIERLNGMLFQAGMSGSPAVSKDGTVIGILVRGVGEEGQKVILEPATALTR